MGWQLYKQKNGNYAIWSNIIDDFIPTNCDIDFIFTLYKTENISNEKIHNIITEANLGHRHYSAPDYPQECLYWIKKGTEKEECKR